MRTLKFIVEDQIIKQDPNCDFSGLVPGSEGYLRAEFALSSEWREASAIVVSFWSDMGREYQPKVLNDDLTCTIPAEALEKRIFKIRLMGITKDDKRLSTNKVTVEQNG